MKKWLGVFCLTCMSQSWAADARFVKPVSLLHNTESRIEKYVKTLEAKYEQLRTIKKTESSCWLLDYRKKGVWLRFEKSM